MLKTLNTYAQSLPLVPESGLPTITLAMIVAGCIGFSVRLAYEWGKNTLTPKNAFIRLIFAVCLSYTALFVWMDFNIEHNVVYWIAAFCLMSQEIIYEFIKVVELGLKGYMQRLFNYVLAKNE